MIKAAHRRSSLFGLMAPEIESIMEVRNGDQQQAWHQKAGWSIYNHKCEAERPTRSETIT